MQPIYKDILITNDVYTMIPSINNWFYIQSKKPEIGSIVIACINNIKFEIKNFPRFAIIPIIFHSDGFLPLLELSKMPKYRPLEDIIVWQPLPNPPHDLREKNHEKGKCYCHGKFFETETEMFDYSKKWLDLPFDYKEFCNQVRIMMSAIVLNSYLRQDTYTNREAYLLARIQLGWGME